MLTRDEILLAASETGFSHAGTLDPAGLEFMPEVRDMCAADRCHMYGRNWTCPPGCGTLEEMRARALGYRRGVLLQSTGTLEDDFDIETMQETERLHKERFLRLVAWLRERVPGCLPMASGACQICQSCTYPEVPCRFPDRAIPSMEACGLLVSRVCEQAGLPYYYGARTMTYTSCVLID